MCQGCVTGTVPLTLQERKKALLNANSLSTNVIITILVMLLVIVMPVVDLRVCSRLGLNVMGGVSTNPDAERLLRIRKWAIGAVLAIYAAGFAWLVFFSRVAAEEYVIHTALFEDFAGSFQIDLGILEFFRLLFTEGFSSATKHFRIINFAGITQVYMNIMLFVPMGYLLPYCFSWFRAKVKYRPVIACFLISFLTENLQLITKRGFYDLDDLISNTIGGYLGQLFFIAFAYVVTHPNWRKERRRYRRWKRNARKRTLYPFARKVDLSRTVLLATDESGIWDYYVMKLGFRPVKQIVPEDTPDTSFLLELGSSQVEIRCSNKKEQLPVQYLVISVKNIPKVRQRLELNGITPGPITQDPFTDLRCFSFDAPDRVCITILEK